MQKLEFLAFFVLFCLLSSIFLGCKAFIVLPSMGFISYILMCAYFTFFGSEPKPKEHDSYDPELGLYVGGKPEGERPPKR